MTTSEPRAGIFPVSGGLQDKTAYEDCSQSTNATGPIPQHPLDSEVVT